MKKENKIAERPLDDIDQCFAMMDMHKAVVRNHVMMDVFIAHDSLIRRHD